ncbi:MAG: hypothetical protein AABZ55_00535 [Bdellovibrionota bacterium]
MFDIEFHKLRLLRGGTYIEARPSLDRAQGSVAVHVDFTAASPHLETDCSNFENYTYKRSETAIHQEVEVPYEIDIDCKTFTQEVTICSMVPGSTAYPTHTEHFFRFWPSSRPLQYYFKGLNFELHARAELGDLRAGDLIEMLQSQIVTMGPGYFTFQFFKGEYQIVE